MALLIFPVTLMLASVYGLLAGILAEVVVDVLRLFDAFDVAPCECLPLLPLLVHAVLETLSEVLGYATSFQG